jgi:hypothetical protein
MAGSWWQCRVARTVEVDSWPGFAEKGLGLAEQAALSFGGLLR